MCISRSIRKIRGKDLGEHLWGKNKKERNVDEIAAQLE